MIENMRILGHQRGFKMERLYAFLGETRQNHHQKVCRVKRLNFIEQELLELVLSYRVLHPRMGSRQLFHTMRNAGEDVKLGITKFEKFMSRHGLTVRPRRSKKPRTSDGLGRGKYENLTNGLIINGINQLIVADITYYDITECRCYIFALKDVYSQRILGLTPSIDMSTRNAISCLDQMREQRKTDVFPSCIHHTDNGSQYNSDEYKIALKNMKIKISRSHSCVENGSIEQMHHIVKNMYFDPWHIDTFRQLRRACKKIIELNNNHRAIKQLGNQCPNEFEKHVASIPQKDRPQKLLYDFTNWK